MNKSQTTVFAVLLFSAALAGCTSTRMSNTDRTGVEQLLISNAIDQAIESNEFSSVQDRNVFVQDKYLDCTDKPYILGTLRSRVLDAGGRLVEDAAHADVVMEIRSGGIGTDSTDKYFGLAGLAVPGLPFELPDVRVWEKNIQYGTAKIAITCFDTHTGEQLEASGNVVARADRSQWNVMGFSPGIGGSVERELATAVGQPSSYLDSEFADGVTSRIARGKRSFR